MNSNNHQTINNIMKSPIKNMKLKKKKNLKTKNDN